LSCTAGIASAPTTRPLAIIAAALALTGCASTGAGTVEQTTSVEHPATRHRAQAERAHPNRTHAKRAHPKRAAQRHMRASAFPPPKHAQSATITGVTDGDTIELSGVGKVRLIGIDTPEVFGHTECFGRAASAFTKSVLITGRHVLYRLGLETHDRYGRALAYVWLDDGRMFNGMLAERGYATPLTIPPDDDYARLFLAAARRARLAARGLWSPSTCNGVNPSNHPGDKDCSDFKTHAEAQRWFNEHGGSATNNVDNLDGEDHDGRVCETLP
jgi:endonuclease YncB( thermonuclease family)